MGNLFGGVFHDYLNGPWEQVRGLLREELEQLKARLNHTIVDLSDDNSVENRLDYSHLPEAVDAPSVIGAGSNGDFSEIPLGPGLTITGGGGLGISLSQLPLGIRGRDGDRGRMGPPGPSLPGPQGPAGPPGRKGSAGDSGRKIIMLQGSGTGSAASYIPLSLGVEPLQFVSDGAGSPILVTFSDN